MDWEWDVEVVWGFVNCPQWSLVHGMAPSALRSCAVSSESRSSWAAGVQQQ